MSDEEEEVATKRKRLTKKGKTTLADDSSSEDDDLFGSDNDEDEQQQSLAEEKVVDATYSKENLESAMVRQLRLLCCNHPIMWLQLCTLVLFFTNISSLLLFFPL